MSSGSYAINFDYTSLGRVELKIQVMADSHEQALQTAQNLLDQQKTWYKKHKEEARKEQDHYKKLLHFGPDYDAQAHMIEQKQQQIESDITSSTATNEFIQKTMTDALKGGNSKGIM
jgi:hypothetical protein